MKFITNPAGQNDLDAWDTLHCTLVFHSSEHSMLQSSGKLHYVVVYQKTVLLT